MGLDAKAKNPRAKSALIEIVYRVALIRGTPPPSMDAMEGHAKLFRNVETLEKARKLGGEFPAEKFALTVDTLKKTTDLEHVLTAELWTRLAKVALDQKDPTMAFECATVVLEMKTDKNHPEADGDTGHMVKWRCFADMYAGQALALIANEKSPSGEEVTLSLRAFKHWDSAIQACLKLEKGVAPIMPLTRLIFNLALRMREIRSQLAGYLAKAIECTLTFHRTEKH
jgi:hypothetical protein